MRADRGDTERTDGCLREVGRLLLKQEMGKDYFTLVQARGSRDEVRVK